ncbi:MAG: class I SAM-dependent methyltransferase [Halobacteriaceae archaeon]
MGHHTFDPDGADRLNDAARRYRHLSRDELLGALALAGDEAVADLGSGTGFYTDDVAEHAGHVYAVDCQPAMHEHYRRKDIPANVSLVTGDVEAVPVADGAVDAVVTTMTYHEFAADGDAIAELHRVLAPGGRVVVADWSADGAGERGPPLAERFTADDAVAALRDGGFAVSQARSRPETFLVVAER